LDKRIIKHHNRIKQTGEIFTPSYLVDEIINKLPLELFIDPSKTFIDPAAGDGKFLRGVVRKLMVTQLKFNFQHSFDNQLYGVELMWDNVCDTIYFLLTTFDCDEDENKRMRETLSGKYPITQDGFDDVDTSQMTPMDINSHFVYTRKYKCHDVELWVRKKDNHYVEYTWSDNVNWITSHHIVRADALIEWDFDNWESVRE